MQVYASAQTLEKLEWPALLQILADFSQTVEGRSATLALTPHLTTNEVQARWDAVEPLKLLAAQGLKAPIGELLPMAVVFRAASKGQVLDGPSLRAVADLLESTRRTHAFASGYENKCSTLRRTRGQLLPMPQLLLAITKAVGAEGQLLDDASPELSAIRRSKVQTRRRIEETLTKLIHGDSELMAYLQDDFFTLRAERYVVPMKLDGRGRVKGMILDTSASGQTLYIEPLAIAPLNAQLLDLDLEEKLEIARIFRELSGLVEKDLDTLKHNYEALIALDVMTAEASLGAALEAGPAKLRDQPGLDLRDARHPLISRQKTSVSNAIALDDQHNILIVSGPNAGGKTVVLKTVGLLHLMAKAGLLLPVDSTSSLYLYDHVYLEMGDAQNLSANLSTFSGHLMGLRPILESAGSNDLVLLDELAVGTDPETGAAIGAAILESLADRGVRGVVTTHFDALKSMALSDRRFRNGSMEFSLQNLRPTYRLLLDLPGQSFGLEVAEQIGLPPQVLKRAKELRHGRASSMDQAVAALMAARDEAESATKTARGEKLQAEAERLRWQNEVEHMQEARRKASQQLADRYEERLADLRREFEAALKEVKQAAKDQVQDGRAALLAGRQRAEQSLKEMGQTINEIQRAYDIEGKLPGQPASRDLLSVNTPVYVLPLKKTGRVLRIGAGGDDTIEVEVGILKLRVPLHDLRVLSPGEGAGSQRSQR
ncbi:MAG: hypothetical protein FJ146_05515 [Deltaproteobacteria bacterium]|nr:hypothetical protein [Deltaproteobacteria bacterium]